MSTANLARPQNPSGLYNFDRTFTQGPNPLTASNSAGYGLATLLLGAPTGGSFGLSPQIALSNKSYDAYLQDDWKIRRNFTLNLGVRWDYQTPWTERYDRLGFFDPSAKDPLTGRLGVLRFVGKDGAPRYQTDPQKTNFAPRLGLEWQFAKDTVFRSAYGLFYFPGSGRIGASPNGLGEGFITSTPVYLGQPPAAPNTPPLGASLADPFVTGLQIPPTTLVGSNLTTALRDWLTSFSQQWNASLQRTVFRKVLVEAAYVGNRGERLWSTRSFNAVRDSYLSLGSQLDDLVANPFYGIVTQGTLSAATVRRSQLLRPYPQYLKLTRFNDTVGDSIYHSLTLRTNFRRIHGVTLQGAYTISKAIDNAPEGFAGRSSIANPNNLRASRSLSDWDRPQFVVLTYIYELPLGKGKKWIGGRFTGAVLGNWQVSGISTFGKGMPIVITGPSNTRLPDVNATPMQLKSPILQSGQDLNNWFDKTAFTTAPAYSLGNDSRTEPNLRAPGINTFDLAMSRSQPIREKMRLKFRAEMFNAFNKPQFDAPNSGVTGVNFGKINSATGARVVQFALRLSY